MKIDPKTFFRKGDGLEPVRKILQTIVLNAISDKLALRVRLDSQWISIDAVKPDYLERGIKLTGRWVLPTLSGYSPVELPDLSVALLLFRVHSIEFHPGSLSTFALHYRSVAEFIARNLLGSVVMKKEIIFEELADEDVPDPELSIGLTRNYVWALNHMFGEDKFKTNKLLEQITINCCLPVDKFSSRILEQGFQIVRETGHQHSLSASIGPIRKEVLSLLN